MNVRAPSVASTGASSRPARRIVARHRQAFASFGRTDTCTSASCASGIGDGAPVIRHCAVVVFGKAITSRIDSVPAISAAMRSMPKAMPPCGGAP